MEKLIGDSAEEHAKAHARDWEPGSEVRNLAMCQNAGLWDQGVYPHFCDTRESPFYMGGLSLGGLFLLYRRSGHFPQPCQNRGLDLNTGPRVSNQIAH